MAQINFHKVATLPGVLQPNSLYFVENGTIAETYITNSVGVARSVGNSEMITSIVTASVGSIVDDAVDGAIASLNAVEIVADIDARDALAASLSRNALIIVEDATADPTVDAGSAMYAYNHVTDTFSKLTEYESLDVVISWANISGRPASTPAQIDDAVEASHNHSNKSTLDKLGEDAEGLTFEGQGVNSRWATLNW